MFNAKPCVEWSLLAVAWWSHASSETSVFSQRPITIMPTRLVQHPTNPFSCIVFPAFTFNIYSLRYHLPPALDPPTIPHTTRPPLRDHPHSPSQCLWDALNNMSILACAFIINVERHTILDENIITSSSPPRVCVTSLYCREEVAWTVALNRSSLFTKRITSMRQRESTSLDRETPHAESASLPAKKNHFFLSVLFLCNDENDVAFTRHNPSAVQSSPRDVTRPNRSDRGKCVTSHHC